ncbi:MAG: dihydrodipicolinate synthase family protein [Pseudomonadales bacterium]|nr:dihydrodipicolinate synthase family protein [Pseudomonadales bacterium]
MSQPMLSGIIAYPVTPFTPADGKVDLPTLGIVIDELINSGACAIAALGSAGEGAYLNEQEWQQVATYSVEHVAGRVPVIIGISELTTTNAVLRAQFAEGIGADAIMVAPLSYYKLSEAEIYQHYAAISDAINIPIMLYNNPATSGIDMSPAFMLSMVEGIENVTMIKESTGDIQRMHQIYKLSQGKVPFFNGCNYMALEALNAGAAGWCTAAPCLIGDKPKALFDAVQRGEAEEAQELFSQQLELLEFIVKGGLAATVKAGLEMRGINAGLARKPLLEIPEASLLKLKQILQRVNA